MQQRGLRKFELVSAQRLISAPRSPDTLHRSSPMVCLAAHPCGSTHTPKVGLKIWKVPPSLNLILAPGDPPMGGLRMSGPKPSSLRPQPAGDLRPQKKRNPAAGAT